ncbi:pyridoxal phosphate-dependent transferase [Schizophyllum amplum]|uniref:Pyridoxal phosphate-dependent transferase n=1 Tax=Schizophyllum amplum TaxID=97359 RepID=A0A550C1Y1_9AGAR|nr:pyridoxal phosphate-dependent transferase [Auriculariopsis ampla]
MDSEILALAPNSALHSLDQKPAPKFGHDLAEYFLLDPQYLNLNHGSYGTCPAPVVEFAFDLDRKIEANPDLFMRITCAPLLAKARAQLAEYLGVKTDEVVIVSNASHGINTILRNIEWEPCDTILICNTTYNAVDKTVQNLHDSPPHPHISSFTILHPTTNDAILRGFEEHVKQLVGKKLRATSKIVAVIDSISSNPGILLPWEKMVTIAKRYGLLTVIDAAHSIGQEPNIKEKIAECQPDFYVTNAHKWLFAKRGAAIMYVPERNQYIVKSSIPTSATYVSPKDRTVPNQSFVVQYDWNGTIDWANYLSVPAAFKFRSWLGGEDAINGYTHKLAMEGGKRMAEILQVEMMYPGDPGTECSMVNLALPLPPFPDDPADIRAKIQTRYQRKLLFERKMGAAHFFHNGRWWVRVSAQVWLEMEDFEKLAKGISEVCAELIDELGLDKYVPPKK